MFKTIDGFDLDVLKKGNPIHILDSRDHSTKFSLSHVYGPEDLKATNGDIPPNVDLEGNYLIKQIRVDLISLVSSNGHIYNLALRHFIGKDAAFTIEQFILARHNGE